MMYYYGGFSPFHMSWFGPVLSVLFWGAFVYGIILLARSVGSGNSGGRNRAMEILKERYAKGEITKEQFESMKKDLE